MGASCGKGLIEPEFPLHHRRQYYCGAWVADDLNTCGEITGLGVDGNGKAVCILLVRLSAINIAVHVDGGPAGDFYTHGLGPTGSVKKANRPGASRGLCDQDLNVRRE